MLMKVTQQIYEVNSNSLLRSDYLLIHSLIILITSTTVTQSLYYVNQWSVDTVGTLQL